MRQLIPLITDMGEIYNNHPGNFERSKGAWKMHTCGYFNKRFYPSKLPDKFLLVPAVIGFVKICNHHAAKHPELQKLDLHERRVEQLSFILYPGKYT